VSVPLAQPLVDSAKEELMLIGRVEPRIYCSWCSLALGEQERRANIDGKVYHDRCAETVSKKGKIIKVDFKSYVETE